MPSDYFPNPLAAQTPDTAPQPGQAPELALPIDSESGAASLYQPWKRLGDEAGYVKSALWIRHQELWLLSPSANYTSNQTPIPNFGWLTVKGTGTFAFNGGAPGLGTTPNNGNSAQLALGAANSSIIASTTAFFAPFGSTAAGPPAGPHGCILDLQGYVLAPSFTGGAGGRGVFIGFSSASTWTSGAGQPNDSVGLLLNVAGTTWSLFNGGSSTAFSGTYSPSAGLWQRFRVAWYGAATPQGIANGNTAFAAAWMSAPGASAFITNPITQNGTPASGSGNHYIVQGLWSSVPTAASLSIAPYVFQTNPQAWGT